MDTQLMVRVLASMVFFAPLLIGLMFFLVIGGMVVFEGLVQLAAKRVKRPAIQALPMAVPGPIAAGLDEAIREVEAAREESKETANASE